MRSEQPNVLIIMADQFRNSCLGFRGEDPTFTPHLDAFAAEARDVRQAVSSYPVCSPHRAMFMTGQAPHRNGVPVNINSRTGAGLRPDIETWSSLLKANGYNTGYIGKWHLEAVTEEDAIWGEGFREGAVWDAYSPMDRRHGFSFWYSYGAADNHMHPHYWIGDAPREHKTTVDKWSVEHETDVAIRFLRDTAGQEEPFALMVSYNPPHQPFDLAPSTHRHRYNKLPPAELLSRPNVEFDSAGGEEAVASAAQYFAAVSAVDEQVGRLLAEVSTLGMAQNTIVIFTSDHGLQLGSHGLMYKNVPWQESVSIPFLIRWPERIPNSVDDSTVISSMDFAPTLLGLVGLPAPADSGMQGRDYSKALTEVTVCGQGAALYYGPPKKDGSPGIRGLRTRQYKLLATPEAADGAVSFRGVCVQLYDLLQDPFELEDIATTASTDLVRELARQLVRELTATLDPWPHRDDLIKQFLPGEVHDVCS